MRSLARIIGIFLIIIGGIKLFFAMNMDTTVETGGSVSFGSYIPTNRVHNIGLMAERQNGLIISSFMIVAGILTVGFTELLERGKKKPNVDDARCPRCNGEIDGRPEVCRHCRSELHWLSGKPYTPEGEAKELARREAQKQLQVQKEIKEAEQATLRREQAAKSRQAVYESSRGVAGRTIRAIAAAPAGFDAQLRKGLGEDNVIVYRFVQAILYIFVPSALLVVIVGLAL